MESGRKLDWEIRYNVYGIETDAFDSNGELWTWDFQKVPRYSTDISAAWELVEKFVCYRMQKLPYNDHRVVDGKTHQCFLDRNRNVGYGRTLSEAICKAALLAVMEDES